MKREDLIVYCSEEIKEDEASEEYFTKDDVMGFIDKIESRVNDFVKDLDSIDSIAGLYRIETVRDEIKTLGDELY